MAEELLAAEVLVIGVLHPARAQHLVRQRMHVLEDEETGDQPGRQRRLAGARRADRGEAPFQKAPVDLLCQPDQRVTHIDDPLQGRPEQILLPLIARLRHRFPRAISARSRNHDPPQIGIANCKKPQPNPAFPAKSITRSSQIVPLSQRYPNSSRPTASHRALPHARACGGRIRTKEPSGYLSASGGLAALENPCTAFQRHSEWRPWKGALR